MKNEVMDRVLKGLLGILDTEQLRLVSDTMMITLSDYRIEKEKHEIMSVNDNWHKHLEMYMVSKMVEGKSEKTIRRYGYELNKLLINLNKNVTDITNGNVFGYMARYKKDRKISNKTLDNMRLVYSSFFSWLHNRGIIVRNPMFAISSIKCEKRIKQPFSDEERQKLFDACKNNREKALIEFLYSTCVRIGELVKLDIRDVKFNEKELVVYGKGDKERTVYINDKASMYLKYYLNTRSDSGETLFASVKRPNGRLTENAIRTTLKNIGKRAGVVGVHPHRFRRTGATNALARGMALQEVQKMLGHAKPDTTLLYCTIGQEAVKYSHKKYMAA